MSRLNKVDEIIELAICLQNSYIGLTIDDIAQKLELSRRSAERIKCLLEEKFGDKLEEVPTSDKKKHWRLKKGTMNFLISFSKEEFALLEQIKSLLTDEIEKKKLAEIIAKIKALTGQTNLSSVDTDVEAIVEASKYAVRQYPQEKINPNFLKRINEGILAFKKLKIKYRKASGTTFEKVIHPYGVLISDYKYLVAFSEYDKMILIYKISRILKIEVEDEYFEKDEKFDLKEYSQRSFGIFNSEPMAVELLFSSSVRENVLNYHFHPTQEMRVEEDGRVRVKLKASGEEAICNELFKWRGNVKILAPESLKGYYQEKLEECLNILIN